MRGLDMSIRLIQDPGHGGDNTGAQVSSILEKHLNLSISRDIEAFLDGWPFLTQMQSRLNDDDISYEARGKKARSWKADLVICHHCNTMPNNPEVSGLTTFVRPGDSMGYEIAHQIARAAPSGLQYHQTTPFVTEKLHLQRNEWKTAANNVLSAFHPIPTVLVEWGYMTNPQDRAYLLDLVQRPAMATAVLAGLARYVSLKHQTAIMEVPRA